MDLGKLVLDNYEWLYGKARKMCYDESEIDDLVADTVLRILESDARFDPSRGFRPWAQTIMHNLRYTQIVRRKCVEFMPLAEYDAPTALTPEEETQAAIVRNAIDALAMVYDSVKCVRLFVDGYTVAEISEITGTLPATVRSRLFSGRKRIRETLARIGIKVSKC